MKRRISKPESFYRNVMPQRTRRRKRLGLITTRLSILQRHFNFEYEFDQYLGLPAYKIRKGRDCLVLHARHGQVYLNDKLIRCEGLERGLGLVALLIKREFKKRKNGVRENGTKNTTLDDLAQSRNRN